MQDRQGKTDVLILGVHLKSEGYPNVLYRIDDLEMHPDIIAHEINFPIMPDPSRSSRKVNLRFPRLFRVIYGHVYILIRYLFSPHKQVVYVPYPATFVCWILSHLPKRLRPSNLIIDQFISLYDTIVLDRRLISQNGLLAKLLFHIERRALRSCNGIIVDTQQSREYIEKFFNISSSIIYPIPLSTNEYAYKHNEYKPSDNRCRVLFIGTLIPLHGIQVIISAIKLLHNNEFIEFRIIGDGQDSKYLEEFLMLKSRNLVWIREWKAPDQLAKEIEQSDICLGIFSDTEKADRVCPLKIYAYMSVGRTVITADTEWSRDSQAGRDKNVFCTIEPNNAVALAKQIEKLAIDKSERKRLSSGSNLFYMDKLCNKIAIKQLAIILSKRSTTTSK
jgi:glycosyltransferase involved in cell wall biosynthesis